jgi:lipid II:glycine glycyltransferase (peptidoglycan interpeptide bridge formation enzyme)
LADIEILTLNEKDKWHSALREVGITDFYFTPEYAELCGLNEEGESLCYVYIDGEKTYVYPFRLRDLPVNIAGKFGNELKDITSDYGYGGPISNCEDKVFISAADEKFKEFCNEKNIITEFVRFHPVLNNHGKVAGSYDLVKLNPTVIVDLDESEKMLCKFRRDHRYGVRKSFKQGLEVRLAKSEIDWRLFQKIYEETMQHLAAEQFYFFPSRYYNYLSSLDKNAFLLLADFNGETIGAACFLYDDNCLHYHLSGMKRQYRKLNSNKRLLFEAFKIAYEKGIPFAHLGGGFGGSVKDTLMEFKSGFSPLRRQFHIAKRVHNKQLYNKICKAFGFKSDTAGFFPAYRAFGNVEL